MTTQDRLNALPDELFEKHLIALIFVMGDALGDDIPPGYLYDLERSINSAMRDPNSLLCRAVLEAIMRDLWGTTAHLVRLPTNDNDGPVLWWAMALGLTSEPFLYPPAGRELHQVPGSARQDRNPPNRHRGRHSAG